VDHHAARFQFDAQFVQRQFACRRYPLAHEAGMGRELASARSVTLTARRQRARLAPELYQLVHETRRHVKAPRSLPVAVTLIHIRGNTFTQCHRVRFAHRGSPSNRNESSPA